MFLIYSLKNPSFPECIYPTDTGVMCLDFHPSHPNLLCAGRPRDDWPGIAVNLGLLIRIVRRFRGCLQYCRREQTAETSEYGSQWAAHGSRLGSAMAEG